MLVSKCIISLVTLSNVLEAFSSKKRHFHFSSVNSHSLILFCHQDVVGFQIYPEEQLSVEGWQHCTAVHANLTRAGESRALPGPHGRPHHSPRGKERASPRLRLWHASVSWCRGDPGFESCDVLSSRSGALGQQGSLAMGLGWGLGPKGR